MATPFFQLFKNNSGRYVGQVASTQIVFCEQILQHLNIPPKITPYALFFYHGTSFVLEKQSKKEWVDAWHRLDGSFQPTHIKIEKEMIGYFFNGINLFASARPVNLDQLFAQLGNKISFDCYYYE
jgi:hypothetical protein